MIKSREEILAQRRKWTNAYRKKYPERQRANDKARRIAWGKVGRCNKCGREKSNTSLKRCSICNKNAKRYGIVYRKNNKPQLKAKGVAYRESANGRYNRLVLSAKIRNISLSISKEKFIDKYNQGILSTCYYCNRSNPTLGLDRIDNKLGYHWNNVVPCCKECNALKLDDTQIKFAQRIKAVYNNWAKTFNSKDEVKDMNQVDIGLVCGNCGKPMCSHEDTCGSCGYLVSADEQEDWEVLHKEDGNLKRI